MQNLPDSSAVHSTSANILQNHFTLEACGRAEGKAEGKAELVLRLFAVRFGPVPGLVIERVHNATPPVLDAWAERVVTATPLDDVFR